MKKGLVLIVIILMMSLVNVQASIPFQADVHVEENLIIVESKYGDFTYVLFTDKIKELDKTKPINPDDIMKTLELTEKFEYHDLYKSVSYKVKQSGLYTLIFTNKDKVVMIKQIYVEFDPDSIVENMGGVVAGTIYSDDLKYLMPEKLIESMDVEIITLANQLDTPYDMMVWVNQNIMYDDEKQLLNSTGKSSTLKWGAKETLTSRKGICYDMSALLVAICRAKGIPALITCGGYEDAWHSWVMAFVDGEWVHMDPTTGIYNQIPEGFKLYGEYKVLY